MKALVTGASGQLGRALQKSAPPGTTLLAAGSDRIDITDPEQVSTALAEFQPDVIFNAAAYTAVDRAETDEGRAFAINATAVGYLAAAAEQIDARFVHVSTDFVFDGRAGVPYPPDAATAPLGVYGRSKHAGEVAAGGRALIVRTAWLYGPTGSNFVRTMLRLMAERSEVRVVADQIGTPTYVPGLADALWRLVAAEVRGIHHYTDSGTASWYDFAVAIQEEALGAGLLAAAVPVIPINTIDFPTPARRPSYSVLDKGTTFAALGGPAAHWRVRLRDLIEAIKDHG